MKYFSPNEKLHFVLGLHHSYDPYCDTTAHLIGQLYLEDAMPFHERGKLLGKVFIRCVMKSQMSVSLTQLKTLLAKEEKTQKQNPVTYGENSN